MMLPLRTGYVEPETSLDNALPFPPLKQGVSNKQGTRQSIKPAPKLHYNDVIDVREYNCPQDTNSASTRPWSAPTTIMNVDERPTFPSVWARKKSVTSHSLPPMLSLGRPSIFRSQSALPCLPSVPSTPSTSTTPSISPPLPSPMRPRTESFASSASSAVHNSWTRFTLWCRFKMLRAVQTISSKQPVQPQQAECNDRWTVTAYC